MFLLITTTANAGNYTWNGATSTNWSTSSNWSPAGVPSTNDTVTLSNGGVNSILLDGNRTITRLVISANTIDLNTYELHVSGRSSLNGGAINNGNLKIRGTYVYFQGTNFNCILDVIAAQIKFSGGTFDKTGSFEQNGSASGWGEGGCIFNDDVTIKNTGTVYLRMGQDAGDTFNGKVYLYSSGGYAIQMSYGDTSYFNDTIYVNSTGNGGISFANGTYGASILGDSACLFTGSTGISAGTIQFKNIVQTATSSNSITASGTVLFNVYSNSFLGKVNFTAPNLVVKSTTFGDSTSLTKTGHTLNNTWDGANVYNGVVTITNGNTSTAYVKLASQNADTYNKDVYFNAGTGAIQAANAGTNIYNGNVSVNGNNVTFNTSGGTLKFAGEENQEFGGGTNTLTFNKLVVDKAGGNVTLNQPITIDSLLQLTSGIIYTDTIITLKATATTTGASNQSFVDGTVKKIGNTAFVFPVGDENTFFPVEISAPSSSSDVFMVTYFSKPQYIGSNLDTSLYRVSSCNYWKIERIVGSSNVDVKLYWDSMGCALFDTLNMAMANWDGSKWKNLGYSQILGDPNIGSIKNGSSVNTFGYFSIAELKTNLAPSCSLGFTRSLPPDFFGFNGANTIEVDQTSNSGIQTWADILAFNPPFVQDKKITLLRIPGGTLGNFLDWRTGWPKLEKDLPYNWDYDKFTYKKLNDGAGNEMQDFANNINLVGARPIFMWNVLSSKFLYEVASVYRANEVNLPVKYIELGNELYLEDEYYKEVFPSVADYVKFSETWISDFKQLIDPQITGPIEWAIVGSDFSNGAGGRRNLWTESLLNLLPSNTDVGAFVIHDYIRSGVPVDQTTECTKIGNSFIQLYFNKVFKEGEFLKTNTLDKINLANTNKFSLNQLEVWITEFNCLDFESAYIGSWAHGLFNVGMALKYLESDVITKVVSHTMASDGVFGNIFESECGFSGLKCHGTLPSTACPADFTTNKGEFTALGNALNQFALATKDAVTATQLDFYGGVLPIIISANEPLNPELYGWMFTKGNGDVEFLIVNFSYNNVYNLTLPSTPVGSNLLLYDQLTHQTIQNVVLGNAVSAPATNFQMKLTTLPHNIAAPITLPEGSLTRVYFQNRNLSARLTDDEICENSTTTIIIEGGNGSHTVAGSGLTITQIGNSNVYDVTNSTSLSSTLNTTISVTCSGFTTVLIPITIHENFANDLTILVDGTPATPNEIFFSCPETSITLEAQFTKSTAGTYSTSGDYHFLWAPDTGITSNICSTQLPICPEIEVDPKRPTKYTVYVTDDFCWQSASVIIKPIVEMNLGVDQTICNGTTIEIVPTYVVHQGGFNYNLTWTPGNTNGLTYTYIPTVAGDQIITAELVRTGSPPYCVITDEVNIKSLNCCSGTFSVKPTLQNGIFASYSEDLVNAVVNPIVGNCPTCIQVVNSDGTNVYDLNKNQKKVTIDLDGHTNTYTINGDFIVDNDIKDQNNIVVIDGYDLTIKNGNLTFGPEAQILVGDNRKFVLENCTLSNCTSEMWNGISVSKTGVELPPSIEFINCVFTGAIKAINLSRESNFIIEDCTFENNYIDVHFEKYQKLYNQDITNGVSTNNYIRGCTFTSDGNALLSPYNTVHKFAGISLNDVRHIVLGDSALTVDYNIFNNSNYGIYSYNSSFDCYHSSFSDIFDMETSSLIREYRGTSIFSRSENDFNDRNMIIGNKDYEISPMASLNNAFLKSNYGIISEGEMNTKIYNNVFGNGNTSNRINYNCIWTNGSNRKAVYIIRENVFYDYFLGVRSFGIHPDAIYHIGHNNFNHAYIPNWSAVNSFQGTAIYMANSYASPTYISELEVPQINIYNNEIGQESEEIEPRIGIFTSQIYQPIIQNNNIYFFRDEPVSKPHCIGIWVQNCIRPKVAGNLILEPINSNPGYGSNLIGMKFDRNLNPCIGSINITENLGYGVSFWDNNGQVAMSTNQFTNCDNGVNLDWAEIGAQGTPDRTDDNEWIDRSNVSPVLDRVKGNTQSNLPIPWFYKPSPAEFSPLPSNIVADDDINPTLPILNCPIILDVASRNLSYGAVVMDTARYDENYQSSFRYSGIALTYKALKSDTTLLDMDDESDASFIEFYNEICQSNIEKYDSISILISKQELIKAAQLLSGIEDTNEQEEYLSNFYNLYLSKIVYDSTLNYQDSSLLIEIAYSHSLLYGDAVYLARNALFLEIHDETLESNLRKAAIQKQVKSNILLLHPNPTSNFFKITMNRELYLGRVQLFDSKNNLVIDRILSNGLMEVGNLHQGVYFVRILSEDGYSENCKLIIIK